MKRFQPASKNDEVAKIVVNILENNGSLEATPEAHDLGADYIKGYDYIEFIDDTHDLFKKLQDSKQLKDFSFQPHAAYRDVPESEGNAIRYKLVKRTFATLSQQSEAHVGVLAFKPMLIDIMDDAKNPGYKVLVYYTPYDNTIEFTSWSKNYRDGNLGADFIQEILTTYAPLLKRKGLQQLKFLQRGTDVFQEFGTYSMYGFPVRFYARTYKIKLVYEKTLETLVIETLISK